MKRMITSMLLLLCSMSIFSQEKDSIIYIFPDKVEMKLYERIQKYTSFNDLDFDFYLTRLEKDTFRLSLSQHNKTGSGDWVYDTNRFILINDKKYPLLLDYDSMFGTSKPNEAGAFGNRDDGFVLRTQFIYEGYSIKFTKTGNYVSESLGIYRKKENSYAELPEKEYFLLHENEYELTYLYAIDIPSYDELSRRFRPAEDIGFLLLYYTETISKKPNDKSGGWISYLLHITPESKGRFRIESLTESIYRFIDFENRTPDPDFNFEQTYQWEFAGYSDDTDSEAARLLKYWYITETQNAKTEGHKEFIRKLLPHYME